MPPAIEVDGSQIWKEKDMSKVKDLKTLEKTFDWSFSTPYMGTLFSHFKEAFKRINGQEVQLDKIIALDATDVPHTAVLEHTSTEEIPLGKLG